LYSKALPLLHLTLERTLFRLFHNKCSTSFKQIVLYRLIHQRLKHRQLSITNMKTTTVHRISLNTFKRGKYKG